MLLTSLAALALGASASQPVPVRAVRASPRKSPRVLQIMSWDAGEVTCANGATFAADTIPPRIPDRTFRPPENQSRVIYSFTLGEDGQALSIREADGYSLPLYGADLAPALAAAQFSPQSRATICEVTFTQTKTPYTKAPLADLVTHLIHSRRRPLPRNTWERFVTGNCSDARKRQLERHTPDYRKLSKLPGDNQWVMISYDIDEEGVPTRFETIGTSGNPALEAASRTALSDSRWVDGDPRTGCWRYDFTAADVIEAPQAPDLAQYGQWPDQCEADDRWARKPRLTYPKPFERRGIEGWAVFRYDVASWGEIGNVELLDAQPANAFGEAGKKVLMSAEYNKVEGGLTGCVEKVIFRLPKKGVDAPRDE